MKIIDQSEAILYRVHKEKFTIVFFIIFVPIWLFFGYFFLSRAFPYFISGKGTLDVDPLEYYAAGLIGLIVFVFLVVFLILSYSMNLLMITDQRVYIRKGISGKLQILNLGDIRSFQHGTSSKSRNHCIHFYLKCGRHIKTGNLYVTLSSLQALLGLLRERFEGRGFTGGELRQMKMQGNETCQVVTRRNLLVLFLLLAPFLLSIYMTIYYLAGTK